MTEDELHAEAHLNAEYEVREALHATFYDENLHVCRAEVLLNLLEDEFMQMDDSDDVSFVLFRMAALAVQRNQQDAQIFDTVGSA